MYLQLKGLTKEFDKKKAVDNLSLTIEKGEILCLLGPSGCGKTTTLKMIGGFLKPDFGSIIIEGEDITKLPPELRPVSTVFQSYALFPHLTVIENTIYGLKFKGYKRKEALKIGNEYLDLVGLLEYKTRKIHELSGGQQQRVALARSLIVNPKVLLLDEPLSNLDAKLRIRMREEIKEIQKKFNTTMVFVTHDQEEALNIADKIAVMNEGLLQQIGTPEEIYNTPKNNFVLNFIGTANIIYENGIKKFIRPENISIIKSTSSNQSSINNVNSPKVLDSVQSIEAVILNKTFSGSFYMYTVKTKDNTFEVKSDTLTPYSIGEKVHLEMLKTGSTPEVLP
ncbi:ABC transporter ATP-binding protein [Clostridium algidicarnis]|uniref:ABC transporter ATP-binding protein n=1 Tax=Clostridium algidicarnis TaxID=37659 RepID=UPI001C0AA2CB|nr:ABC transporter ATP-binding protein [Clostridium algidicarnis]MBU3252013.1 ABC transporter ATP-binding protein [Clostridium algidicarnis]